MFEMVDGTGIIGVDMICPLGVSAPQPPNYDRVELEGTGMLVLPNSLDAPLERLELGGKTEQVQTSGKNLFGGKILAGKYPTDDMNIYEDKTTTNIFDKPVEIKPDTEYIISADGRLVEGNIYIYNEAGKKITEHYSGKFTSPSNAKYVVASGSNTYMTVNSAVQIEYGSTISSYEPYTGGKPSPSPEYQQEIKSVGKWNEEKQKYEVSVKVTGKNLLNLQKESDVNGLYRGWKCGDGEKITLSIKDKNNNADISGCFLGLSRNGDSASGGVLWLVDSGIIKVKEATSTHPYVTIYSTTETTIKKLTERFEIQCERGTVATDYAPYAEQTLTLTSDRPITKWDRLVEQGGQIGWLYGSVIATIDETASISLYTPNGFYVYVKNIDKKEKTGYCDKLYAKRMSNGEPFVLFGNANNNVLYTLNTQEFYGKTVSEIKEKLKEYPLNIIGKSETTEFVPLPQSEQNAIRALKTYYPTTVITADGGELDPDIKVTYRKEK